MRKLGRTKNPDPALLLKRKSEYADKDLAAKLSSACSDLRFEEKDKILLSLDDT